MESLSEAIPLYAEVAIALAGFTQNGSCSNRAPRYVVNRGLPTPRTRIRFMAMYRPFLVSSLRRDTLECQQDQRAMVTAALPR
jgi:hypothetical protein